MTQETSTPSVPFLLSSSIKVTFTNEQLVALALEALSAAGHTFDASTVQSVFSKNGLNLSVEDSVGEASVAKPITKSKRGRKPKEVKTEVPSEEVTPEAEPETKVSKGNNPFEASTKEEVIADVKAKANVPEALFSTDTMEIAPTSTDIPVNAGDDNPFDFSNMGN